MSTFVHLHVSAFVEKSKLIYRLLDPPNTTCAKLSRRGYSRLSTPILPYMVRRRKHIASELSRFLHNVELVHGISKAEIVSHGVYLSHKTNTHASPAASCSGNEIGALCEAFGNALLQKLIVVNTKGFTGHPMSVSFKDVAAVEILSRQRVSPVS
mmetsp:Transcript_21358/g.42771  ORF Transcript_21358/g.42771 Transcript_21358/m.42771 type:complete len:155 (-) Transcript_21358:225-689(-)